ncbi:hypothetical protein DFH09DRAFT_1377169 [Mycena vulgaris]|nr:hypothetical protein DFH09DRAFT_1377169 [Mycena vulgaris]
MLAATTSPTDHPLLRPCPPHKLPIDMASPPSTKRRRTSSSSSPLPPPLDLAAVDTAIRTPRQPPSRRHRPATHPCYHRCPSSPQQPGRRAPSARRDTPSQIARRLPRAMHRLPTASTPAPDGQAPTTCDACMGTRRRKGRSAIHKDGTRTSGYARASATTRNAGTAARTRRTTPPWPVACAEQRMSSASHRRPISARIDARRRICDPPMEKTKGSGEGSAERRGEAGIEKEEGKWDGEGEGKGREGRDKEKKEDHSPASSAFHLSYQAQFKSPGKPCLLRLPLLLARAGALGARGEEGVYEAHDGGGAHVERERAEDERGGDARALELGARGRDEARGVREA